MINKGEQHNHDLLFRLFVVSYSAPVLPKAFLIV